MFESVRSMLWLAPYQKVGTNGSIVVLTPYLPRLKARKEKNLLKGHAEDEVEEVEEVSASSFLFIFINTVVLKLRFSARHHSSSLASGIPIRTSNPSKVSEIISQNITLALVSDRSAIPYNTLPPPVAECKSVPTHFFLLNKAYPFTFKMYILYRTNAIKLAPEDIISQLFFPMNSGTFVLTTSKSTKLRPLYLCRSYSSLCRT